MEAQLWLGSDTRGSSHIHPKYNNGVSVQYSCTNPLNRSTTVIYVLNNGSERESLYLFQQLLVMVHPILKAHGLRVLELSELEDGNFQRFAGMNLFWRNEHRLKIKHGGSLPVPCTITISLRSSSNPSKIWPLEYLLEILVHEITHCWVRRHEQDFLRKLAELRRELENDLGGSTKLASHGYSEDKLLNMPLPGFKAPSIDKIKRTPNETSIRAAKYFFFKYMESNFHRTFCPAYKLRELVRNGFISSLQGLPNERLLQQIESQAYEDREPTNVEEMENPYFDCSECATWRARSRRCRPDRDVCVYCYHGVVGNDKRDQRMRWCRLCDAQKKDVEKVETDFFEIIDGDAIDNEWCADHRRR
jgi:hypothetical protein